MEAGLDHHFTGVCIQEPGVDGQVIRGHIGDAQPAAGNSRLPHKAFAQGDGGRFTVGGSPCKSADADENAFVHEIDPSGLGI